MLDISGFFTSPIIVYSLTFISIAFVILWMLSIYSVYMDIQERTKNQTLIISSLLLVGVFPLIGLLMYGFIKPKVSLAEQRILLLDEKLLRIQISKETHELSKKDSYQKKDSKNHGEHE